ncbi:hypothetical protein BLNAU_16447 [Blattamonas nauphoetae]|uniref:D-ribose pyranase n=1 Tax=Blattamonas nauphoetae TaxID=2049346 RepID=A0ABQ9X8F0_9EUKA|nr:hypothetical protein BLNAU_16447 [Blattamonas nauphoetae]
MILHNTILLSSTDVLRMLATSGHTDPLRIREVVLKEALIPIEPALVLISRNHLILSWIDKWKTTKPALTAKKEFISSNIIKWRTGGIEAKRRGKRIVQILKGEGFGEGIEQGLAYNNLTTRESDAQFHSF